MCTPPHVRILLAPLCQRYLWMTPYRAPQVLPIGRKGLTLSRLLFNFRLKWWEV